MNEAVRVYKLYGKDIAEECLDTALVMGKRKPTRTLIYSRKISAASISTELMP